MGTGMRMSGSRARGLLAAAAAVGALTLAGCAPQGAAVPSVATFRVVDQEFKVELVTPELVANAEALLRGEDVPAIPVGIVVRDDPSVNAPWSWHLDPATIEFADATTEVCDGLPEYVEEGIVTSDYYCPWSAQIVSLEPLGR